MQYTLAVQENGKLVCLLNHAVYYIINLILPDELGEVAHADEVEFYRSVHSP